MPKAGQRKTQLTPRKHPKQDRSRQMVENILQATTRILVKGGVSDLNTNLMAQEAGISVGSLYQYFPSKESAVAALIEQHIESEIPRMKEKILSVAAWPDRRAAFKEFLLFLMGLYGKNKKLRLALIEQFVRVGKQKKIQALENEIAHLLFEKILLPAKLEQREDSQIVAARSKKNLSPERLELREFVLAKSLVGILRSAVLEHSSYLDKEDLGETLAEELCSLLFDWGTLG